MEFDVKHRWIYLAAGIFAVVLSGQVTLAQTPEKVVITHSSESISITPLIYGIEKGFYRREGIDLQFRVLRGELAVSAVVGGKDVDYMYGAGTAITAAVRGLPMKVLSHDFKSLLFYLMGSPRVQSGQDLKGKKVAVASLSGTGALGYAGFASSAGCGSGKGRDLDRHRRSVDPYGGDGSRFRRGVDHAGAVEYPHEAEGIQRADFHR